MLQNSVPYEVIRREDGQAALSLDFSALSANPIGWAQLECAEAEVEMAMGGSCDVALHGHDGVAAFLRQVPVDVCDQALANGAMRLYAWDASTGAGVGRSWRLPLIADGQRNPAPLRHKP